MTEREGSTAPVIVAVAATIVAVAVLVAIVLTTGLLSSGTRQPPPAGGGPGLSIAVAENGALSVTPRTIAAGTSALVLSNASDTYWTVTRVAIESVEDVERLLNGDHQGFAFDFFESLEPMLPATATRIELESGRYAIYIQPVDTGEGGPQPIEPRQLAVIEVR